MACNPCCCWNVKDGAVTIGIWTLVYAFASIVLFGWQFSVINSCRSVTMSQANLQCHYWCPCVAASNSRTSALIEGLFVIQILCLISNFFLLFASIALMYGAHTYSRYLIWPWFPCMLASILCSFAYCIMWWTGDVRSYWLILTIVELIGVLINLYCFVAVLIFYRQIMADLDYYSRKENTQQYDRYPAMYDEYHKDNYYSNHENARGHNYAMPPGYHKDSRSISLTRDEYRKLPDYNEEPPPAIKPKVSYRDQDGEFGGGREFDRDQDIARGREFDRGREFEKGREFERSRQDLDRAHFDKPEDDLVSNWVKDQQMLARMPEHANSEPVTPVEEPFGQPLQHSMSVPSMYAETSGATTNRHHHCHKRHHKHRSSSRSRHKDDDRHEYDRRDSSRRHSKRRHRSSSVGSRSRRSYSSDSYTTDYTEEPGHRRHRSRSTGRYSDDDSTLVSEDSQDRKRHRRRKDREYEKEKRKGPRQVKRDEKTREPKGSVVAMTQGEQPQAAMLNAPWPGGPIDASQGGGGGITIPQHIIIPPSSGTYGPDGRLQPQSYQINSEIRICYDQHGRPVPQSGMPATGTMPVGLSSVPPQIQSAGMPLMPPAQFPNSGGAPSQLRPQPISRSSIV